MTQVVLPNTIEAGTEMVAAEVQGNDEALRDVVNGQLDTDNLLDGAVTLAKLGFKMQGGIGSVTWSGAGVNSAITTITHTLGVLPTGIFISPTGSFAVYRSQSQTATAFDVIATTNDETTPAAGTERFFYWLAIAL